MVSTDICNMALGYLGQARIADMDENSEAGRACKLYYDIVRKTLLTSYRWRFAERHVKLALLNSDVPGWHFTYAGSGPCHSESLRYGQCGNER